MYFSSYYVTTMYLTVNNLIIVFEQQRDTILDKNSLFTKLCLIILCFNQILLNLGTGDRYFVRTGHLKIIKSKDVYFSLRQWMSISRRSQLLCQYNGHYYKSWNIRDCVTRDEKNCESKENEWNPKPDIVVHTINYSMQLSVSWLATWHLFNNSSNFLQIQDTNRL